ncbi:hypothetical protein [Micrococcoides hystricis]|uniref:Cell division protein FtsL n=1 Tax=Micrococcoides hystricis TaxID=1572761 RepID=A0ABV6P6R4_9MICC
MTAQPNERQPLLTAVPSSAGQRQVASEKRPVLRVITGGTKRKNAWFLLSYLIPVLAAVVIILGINVTVSSHQYNVVQMKNQQLELVQQNEALTQQVKNLQAPQNLASRAAELGMVMPASVGSVDVNSQKVKGNPTPAKKSDKPTTWVAKPGVAASSEPVVVKSPKSESASSTGPAATGGTREATPQLAEQELNGGTIPAPRQR